jgi:hypothetical protein
MRNTISNTGADRITPGFSPKPASVEIPMMTESPSSEPETLSPNALLEGPLVQRLAAEEPKSEATVKNGIVSFGK